MVPEALDDLTVFLLSLLVGYAVISRVPATLHTPLMSAANAIHGVVLVGALIIAITADTPAGYALALVATAFAAMNAVGGYVVTDRMLQMFRGPGRRPGRAGGGGAGGEHHGGADAADAAVDADPGGPDAAARRPGTGGAP
ncbi:NAD(P) transhydrogenase subunit alpha [Nocardiopsis mwathae]|uniref:proton-translocating NAD(P)(+) transhydrogenase n=1 Tax=Nocardiopsis mwathae TaxID=1472723 RepID=A0A7X0D4N5_9ACTN|nr:NAD(P) transhydrogenase subunit alpha [Nocardiopsis mwathae]MBB6170976.1 NAD(P) transhydrogenase subunit alpha [Nocardiopsis mwathae]